MDDRDNWSETCEIRATVTVLEPVGRNRPLRGLSKPLDFRERQKLLAILASANVSSQNACCVTFSLAGAATNVENNSHRTRPTRHSVLSGHVQHVRLTGCER
eukprot:6188211-Pleurochrysis_carterae.AAC.2